MTLEKKLAFNYKDIWECYNSSLRLDAIREVIKPYIKEYPYKIDTWGNILIGDFEKSRPCLIAHLDSVHTKKPRKLRLRKGKLTAKNGIGGDDKCGIVAILELLKTNKNVNAIFTADEEIGGLGVKGLDNAILKNVLYFIEIDRQGKYDIVDVSGLNKIASKEMIDAIKPYMEKYQFETNDGIFTDLNILTKTAKKCGINVSCGYYNPHTKQEYVILKDLQNAINFVNEVLKNVNQEFIWQEQEFLFSNFEPHIEKLIDRAIKEGMDDNTLALMYEAYDIGVDDGKRINKYDNIAYFEYEKDKKWK